MQALYALPDHVVVRKLVPHAGRTTLDTRAARKRIRSNRGLIPLAIDPAKGGKVLWGDLGQHAFTDWQFLYTVKRLAEAQAIGEAFTTGIDVLRSDEILDRPLYPSGFIFHISRCGSTLLAKALARSPRNVIINQGGPLQRGLWAVLTDDWQRELIHSDENLALFRHLVLAMTRQRQDGQDRSFIKFISWNVLYLDFITRAFPDVPCLFLYRDPVEVIASVAKETTAALLAKGTREGAFLIGESNAETDAMSDPAYLAGCYAHYFRTALAADSGRILYLNYKELKPGNLPMILDRGLGYNPSRKELSSMREQFHFHAKDDSDTTKFLADSAKKQATMAVRDRRIVMRTCAELFGQLDRSNHNFAS